MRTLATKPTARQSEALSALLREHARIVQRGIGGAYLIGSLCVNTNTFAALQDRRWIEQDEMELGPEKVVRSGFGNNKTEHRYRPPVRTTWKITDAGRAAVNGSEQTFKQVPSDG